MFDLGGVSNSVDMQDLQEKERRKSWELNFSEAVIKNFEEHSRLVRSGEYKLGRFIKRMIRPFSK
jgi:hypothetical protein